MKKFILLTACIAASYATYAQNVGIGESSPASKGSVKGNLSVGSNYSTVAAPANGAIIEGKVGIGTSTPNSSAVLDISSTTSGILVPRMTEDERTAIVSPATGLLIYQTNNSPGFYYYTGSSWGSVGSGTQGPAGTNGTNGRTVLNGATDPNGNVGTDGDFYIKTSTNTLFGPKASGVWPSGVSLVGPTGATGAAGANGTNGTNGTNGADGKTVLNGTSDPTTQGADGDFYINTSTNTLFGPKASGAWPIGVSLVGPTGATGSQGPAGPAPTGTGIVTVNNDILGTPAALTGDVTTSGAGLTTTIATGVITNDKIANNTISLSQKVTGILPVTNGGTNATATPTAGAVPYGTGTAYAFTAAGTSGQVLTSGGTGAPTWATPSYMPTGGIIMWSGNIAGIPSGWALCDGTNGTPDLRERFIVGAGSSDNATVAGTTQYTPGNTGGLNSVTIATGNLPSHTHPIGGNTDSSGVNHTHAFSGTTSPDGAHTHTHTRRVSGKAQNGTQNTSWGDSGTGTTSMDGAHTHTYSGTTSGASAFKHTHPLPANTGATGGGTALDTRPPYYALAFIMKL